METKVFSIAVRVIISFFIFIHLSGYAQEAQLFQPGIISDNGIFGLTLSPDSKHALWVRSKGKRDSLVIVESYKIKGKWQPPKVVSFSGNKPGIWRDIDPMFTPDGKTILFQSNRPVENLPNRKNFDMWAVKKIKTGWSNPYHLGNIVNTDSSESFVSMAKNGNVYFTKENGTNKGDIFVAEFKDNQYQTPHSIGSQVNTENREGNPFVSAEDDYLIFAGNTAGSSDSDLYIIFKTNGEWSKPLNLGKSVNSSLNEFCPFVHKKENRLYFSRMQRNPERIIENTYYIENFSAIIESLRKQ